MTGIKDKVKARTLAKIQRVLVNTAGGVYGVPRYGQSIYKDGKSSGGAIHDIRPTNHKQSHP